MWSRKPIPVARSPAAGPGEVEAQGDVGLPGPAADLGGAAHDPGVSRIRASIDAACTS